MVDIFFFFSIAYSAGVVRRKVEDANREQDGDGELVASGKQNPSCAHRKKQMDSNVFL